MNRGFFGTYGMKANSLNRMECLNEEGDWVDTVENEWIEFGQGGEDGWTARFKLHINNRWAERDTNLGRMLSIKNTHCGDQLEFTFIHTRCL